MSDSELARLLTASNRYGLSGYKVIAWIPPDSATSNPDGQFVIKTEEATP